MSDNLAYYVVCLSFAIGGFDGVLPDLYYRRCMGKIFLSMYWHPDNINCWHHKIYEAKIK